MKISEKIIRSELEKARQREKDAPPSEKLIHNGAVCECEHLLTMIDDVNRESLLERYHALRLKEYEVKMYELMNASKARDNSRMDVLIKIGRKLNKAIDAS